jgi:hypothetical protein
VASTSRISSQYPQPSLTPHLAPCLPTLCRSSRRASPSSNKGHVRHDREESPPIKSTDQITLEDRRVAESLTIYAEEEKDSTYGAKRPKKK